MDIFRPNTGAMKSLTHQKLVRQGVNIVFVYMCAYLVLRVEQKMIYANYITKSDNGQGTNPKLVISKIR